MKKLSIFILLLFLINQIGQAQKKYSLENLEKASQEELAIYLSKSLKLQRLGRTFNIIGGASFGVAAISAVLGGPLGVDSWSLIVLGVGGLAISVTSFATGIPTNMIGKNRVARIHSIMNSAFNDINIDLRPCIQYNLASSNYQPGLTLRFIL